MIKKVENKAVDKATRHVLHHHHEAKGYVTLAYKEENGKWRQYHFKPDELARELPNWLGKDTFFSQNTFYRPQRKNGTVKELRALYVDVDCHNLNYDPHWVLGKLKLEVFEESIPVPNYVIFSGRGLICIWLIEPVPSHALPLWKAVQTYFYQQMVYVGADKSSIDPTRVFRIAGSVNSKNGKEVSIKQCHHNKYVLREIQAEYLPELERKPCRKRKPKPKLAQSIVPLCNLRHLYDSRIRDIEKVAELRKYDLKGYRELFCFLYRYWSCCVTADTEDSLAQMLEFNNELSEPLSVSEVIRATRSAETAWMNKNDEKANEAAIAKGYPGAGYNFKNDTIIRLLNITEEEQKHMKTIIDSREKRRRKRIRDQMVHRKKNGSVSRAEYIQAQQERTEHKLSQLKQAIKRYPDASNVKLAEKLGISEGYIRKLKKKLAAESTRTGPRSYIRGGSLYSLENKKRIVNG
ncbi:replication protein [Bacillus sp. S/N-304-OC-R1]|uniref:replication protein n=1 Tax=Bacillus sp. S/N-304-OC-R1 TaxID=2758034 RepID=UPI0021AE99BB|nr:replication protein [Bacillus sp. S/N-304-OC-R1]